MCCQSNASTNCKFNEKKMVMWYSDLDADSREYRWDETWVSYATPESKQQSVEWRQRWNSSKPLQLARTCAQCFGTERAFCLWTSCLKAPQSTQVSIATHLKNCVAQSRISDVACLAGVLWWFATTPTHTLPPQRKILSRHLTGNNSSSLL